MRSYINELFTFERFHRLGSRVAVEGPGGAWSYEELARASASGAHALMPDRSGLSGARVCHLVSRGGPAVVAQWAVWRAGAVSVPLALSHPEAELEHVVEDSQPTAVIVDAATRPRVEGIAGRLGIRVFSVEDWLPDASDIGPAAAPLAADLPSLDPTGPCLMLYTSGSTGRPKGVVIRRSQIQAWIDSMVSAWGWTSEDRVLNVLPLHHVHGLVNVLATAMATGAWCRLLQRFDAEAVWESFGSDRLTVFMAVPTMYRRLILSWESADSETQLRWTESASRLRLMVSGSAALPLGTLQRWEEITGHRLLERYGMTEIGMALTNPLEGDRAAGYVGQPFPGVDARVVDEDGTPLGEGVAGELEVQGPSVFEEYWRRPDETQTAFRDGWFRTGDQVVVEDGRYRILGRRSVDIIKTGGYKVSALEIENVLGEHESVLECAVVALPDPDWGERVVGAVVSRQDVPIPSADELRAWAKERLAPYKVPRTFTWIESLPRNVMGKVTKPALRDALISLESDSAKDSGTGTEETPRG